MTKARNLIGIKFGRLLPIELDKPIGNRRAYSCLCECGNIKSIRAECLTSGITKSCGCIRSEKIAMLNKTHGQSNSSEYKSWHHAKERILNPKNHKFSQYGGRGILMDENWIKSFQCFYDEWVQNHQKIIQ